VTASWPARRKLAGKWMFAHWMDEPLRGFE
jgi:hypothetical protein